MHELVALCDYKGGFGSKYFAYPYRSGMDKDVLRKGFLDYGVIISYLNFGDCQNPADFYDKYVIYTSQEDAGYKYKSYIEDVIHSLQLSGAMVIPSYKYLRANNNKVSMEFLRGTELGSKFQIETLKLGTLEEVDKHLSKIQYPCVLKMAEGAGSKGVYLAKDKNDLLVKVRHLARSRDYLFEIRDAIRTIRHKGYHRESIYRSKYIIQEFIPGLTNDWKVLVFGEKYYVLRRDNRHGDFRASGSGLFSFDDTVDFKLLDAAKEVFESFDVPMISLDLAMHGEKVFLIEFQFVYFGVSTLEKSPYYYQFTDDKWDQIIKKSSLEMVYAESICKYIGERH